MECPLILKNACVCVLSHFSRVQLYETLWLLCPWNSLGKCTGVSTPCPPPGDLPNPGLKHAPLTSALAGSFFTTRATSNMFHCTHSLHCKREHLKLEARLWSDSQS